MKCDGFKRLRERKFSQRKRKVSIIFFQQVSLTASLVPSLEFRPLCNFIILHGIQFIFRDFFTHCIYNAMHHFFNESIIELSWHILFPRLHSFIFQLFMHIFLRLVLYKFVLLWPNKKRRKINTQIRLAH